MFRFRVGFAALALWCATMAAFAGAPGQAPLPAVGRIETYFTPWDDAEGAIIRTLGEAQQSIHVQAYLLTSRSIAAALIAAHARGVAVAILADQEMLRKGDNSQLPKLAAAGISLWLESRYASAHNKVMLIDGAQTTAIVITGSYNFTWSAQARNAENLLILRQNPVLAQRYLANWQRHREGAQPYVAGGIDGR